MNMLMGEFHHNLDEKKRIIIPSKFRDDLGEKIILTRGLEGCLFAYSEKEWSLIVSKLKSLPFTKKDARSFVRFFLSGATECEFDKQGRITITSSLTQYASLIRECVVIGVNDRLEIWDESIWNKFMLEHNDSLSDIAEHLFEGNLDI